MSYFVLMGRRIPKQAITGFKFQNETDNICPFLSIRIRGKEEIIPFKDKKEIQSVKAHLCSVFSGFVKIGDWYLKMSEVKEYKPVTAEDMSPYIGIWINVTKTGIYMEKEILLAHSAIPRNLLSMIRFQKKMNFMKVLRMKKKAKEKSREWYLNWINYMREQIK